MQPEREPGDLITLRFIQERYRKLWNYARAQTGGAVAVRYQQGSYRRGESVYALWPAAQKAYPEGHILLGLSLGLFECSVVTAHPFPLVRLLPGEAGGPPGPELDAAALHARLRGLRMQRLQGEAVAGLEPRERLALLAWLAAGGGGGGLEVPEPAVGLRP